jgi:hypothetical protein
MRPLRHTWAALALAALLALAGPAAAQQPASGAPAPRDTGLIQPGSIVDSTLLALAVPRLKDAADSAAWLRAKGVADRSTGRRVVVSLLDRRLWWIAGSDTLLSAPVAVGKGTDLAFGRSRWNFGTPRGRRTVVAKSPNPVWVPPLWRYVEEAARRGDTMRVLERGRDARLSDGSVLRVRGRRVEHVAPDGTVQVVPSDQEIEFGRLLFMPPAGTDNREIRGELGAYKLELGDGYMIHGSPDQSVIGRPVTHGCIRLASRDLEYVYQHVPVGTAVYVY